MVVEIELKDKEGKYLSIGDKVKVKWDTKVRGREINYNFEGAI